MSHRMLKFSDECPAESYFWNGLAQVALALSILVYYLYRRYRAIQNSMQGKWLPLPIYFPLLCVLSITVFVTGSINIVFHPTMGDDMDLQSLKWFLYRYVADGMALFLMACGVGIRFVRQAASFGFILAFTTTAAGACVFYLTGDHSNWEAYYVSRLVSSVCQVLFFGVMWIAPMAHISRRPSMIHYARANFILSTCYAGIVCNLCRGGYTDEDEENRCQLHVFFSCIETLQPLVVCRAIYEDSLFWQGMLLPRGSFLSRSSQRAGTGASSAPNLNQPLLGMWSMSRRTIGLITDTVDKLSKNVVPTIPFAALRLDTRGYFSGGTARVYKGMYRNETVAIKIVFCMVLTPERVLDFCEEATLLNSLTHPNIVQCYGISIMPPALSLVTEFCSFGSLYDFLHNDDLVIVDLEDKDGVLWNTFANSNRSSLISPIHNISPAGVPPTPTTPIKPAHNGASARAALFAVMSVADYERDKKRAIQRAWFAREGDSGTGSYMEFSSSETRSSDAANSYRHNSTGMRSATHEDEKNEKHCDHASILASVSNASILSSTSMNSIRTTKSRGRARGTGESVPGDYRLRILSDMISNHEAGSNNNGVENGDEELGVGGSKSRMQAVPGLSPDDVAVEMSAVDKDRSVVEYPVLQDAYSVLNGVDMGFGWGGNDGQPQVEEPGKAARVRARNRSEDVVRASSISSFVSSKSNVGPDPSGPRFTRTSSNITRDNESLFLRKRERLEGDGNVGAGGERLAPIKSGDGSENPIVRQSSGKSINSKFSSGHGNAGWGQESSGNWDYSGDLHGSENSRGRNSSASEMSYQTIDSDVSVPSGARKLPLKLRARMIRDCAAGLGFLHSKGIMHCDIKSLNFLVDHNLNVKLSDLGEARQVSEVRAGAESMPTNINWSAPEVIINSEEVPVKESADVWSLAMVFTEILTLSVPFDTDECHNMSMKEFLNALEQNANFRPDYKQCLADTPYTFLEDVIEGAWAFQPGERLTCVEILNRVDKEFHNLGLKL